MAKRIIEKFWTGTVMVKVYRDSEWDEYSCVLFIDGIKQREATNYYTTDKEDALNTANAMMLREFNALMVGQ